jgi:GMP synthase (glutamine-hydrolysing)
MLTRALGAKRLKGLLVDNGFLRKDEARAILERYRRIGFEGVDFIDASEDFLRAVAGLTDPQEKRKAVGETFIQVRERYLAGLKLDPNRWLLGQGTLYPDIIESGGTEHAEVIKFHHNRVERIGELIAAGYVVEPLKDLYKDEVRALGEALHLPPEIVWRHPFPGPGLSINVLCATGAETYPDLTTTRAKIGEVLLGTSYRGDALPVRSVGVQGDGRTYTPPAVLIGPRDWTALEDLSVRITNGVRAVNRVVALLSPAGLPVLAVRPAFCTWDRLDLLREADAIVTRGIEAAGLMREVFQILVILLPLGTPVPDGGGSAGGSRQALGDSAGGSRQALGDSTGGSRQALATGECLVLRPVVSADVMTAQFARLPWPLVERIAQELMALPDVRAVFYDVTHKPPATFGWE